MELGRRARGPAALLAMLTVACGSGAERTLTVFAASSLTEVFTELESGYEAEHPDVDVVVSFGGSASLAAQIDGGAPADVFAAADRPTMDRVLQNFDRPPVVFATNRLAIAVERGNPLDIGALADLPAVDVVVLAAPEVPAGAYAEQALARSGVELEPASYEQSVRSVVAKVALGEADAGIVYRTDVAANERIDGVDITADVAAEYLITAGDDGAGFQEFVTGSMGRAALERAGFHVP